jgi:hypothetical protein
LTVGTRVVHDTQRAKNVDNDGLHEQATEAQDVRRDTRVV